MRSLALLLWLALLVGTSNMSLAATYLPQAAVLSAHFKETSDDVQIRVLLTYLSHKLESSYRIFPEASLLKQLTSSTLHTYEQCTSEPCVRAVYDDFHGSYLFVLNVSGTGKETMIELQVQTPKAFYLKKTRCSYCKLKHFYLAIDGILTSIKTSEHIEINSTPLLSSDDSSLWLKEALQGKHASIKEIGKLVGKYLKDHSLESLILFQPDPRGAYRLGLIFRKGYYVPANPQQAFFWYHYAAERGHGKAQNNLAFLYEEGIGTVPDPQQSLFWYKEAANAANPQAQYNLGSLYYLGKTLPKDEKLALEFYQKAAVQGHPLAINIIKYLKKK